jgi:ribosome-binding protein aMBF1 (putative translation factor)
MSRSERPVPSVASHENREATGRQQAGPPLQTPEARPSTVFAEKSVFTPEYQAFLRHLRAARREAGLTQVELGQRLGQPQAIISKCERGERRLDVIELRAYCAAMGLPYLEFLQGLEQELGDARGPSL